ncbi:MAG: hypothetical protein JWM27_2594 [Gemmatimonadetes bacterium]|nr:hypothetical protein [Gemmatimonadota bacterium]
MPGPRASLAAAAAALLLTACGTSDAAARGREGAVRTVDAAPPAAHVDSVLPIAEALRRFRVGMGPAPVALTGGEASRDALVRRFVKALERTDTAALQRMAMDRAEFAWLYYPSNAQSRPPYELPPELMWFQTQLADRKGALRALRAYGGRPLRFRGYRCAPAPQVEGENRLWTGCRVDVADERGRRADLRLFGAILERGGRFKFASYSNDL